MEHLDQRHEQQASDARLLSILTSLTGKIPYIASGSLNDMVSNLDKIDLDKEISDFLFKREIIDDDSVQTFKLLAEETETEGVTITANICTQATNATSSNAQTYTDNEFFWFTIDKMDGMYAVDTEYAVNRTTDYPNGKRVTIEKRHGVITEDRLNTLEIYLELGKFDDAFDPISANLLPDETDK